MATSNRRRGSGADGSNPRHPSPNYFVSGGEQKNRESLRKSAVTTYRRVDPDNVEMANCVPNFARDFTEQMKIVPVGKGRALVRSAGAKDNLRTMNEGGKPFATPGITVGAGEDDKGIF